MDWYNAQKCKPESFVSVLVRMPGEKPCPTVREGYYVSDIHIWFVGSFARSEDEITHWTYMPIFPGDDE